MYKIYKVSRRGDEIRAVAFSHSKDLQLQQFQTLCDTWFRIIFSERLVLLYWVIQRVIPTEDELRMLRYSPFYLRRNVNHTSIEMQLLSEKPTLRLS